jgi:hypothetical protein
MYSIAPLLVSLPSPRGVYPILVLSNHSKDHIVALEQEIFALQSGKQFNRADKTLPVIPDPLTCIPPTTSAHIEEIPEPPVPSTTPNLTSTSHDNSTLTNPPASNSTPISSNQPLTTSQPPIHPFAGVKENSYLPPHE